MPPNPYESRTTQKLEFANFYLELRRACKEGGTMEARAHEESFLFHLIGAKDSFLQEINCAFDLGIPEDDVRTSKIRTALKASGKRSRALEQIEELAEERGSWLNIAISLRNRGTHRDNIPRSFDMSERVAYLDPHTKKEMTQDIPSFLSECFVSMVELVTQLRQTLSEGSP